MRFAVTWGNPPAELLPAIMEGTYTGGRHPWHCVACGQRSPRRAAVQCGECAHAWRWAWLLSAHRLWRDLRFGPTLPDGWGGRAPWWRLDRWAALVRQGIRRPSEIWVCPCCAHDL